MIAPRILSAYVLREVSLHTTLGFLGFGALLVSQNLLRRLDDLLAVGMDRMDLLTLLGLLFSMLVAYMIPVSFLFGVLLGVGRLSSDSEILAMRACGLGLRRLLVPLLAFALLFSAVTAVGLIEIEPLARRALRSFFQDVASRGSLIRAGEFRSIGDRVFLVRERDRDNQLEGVMIWDSSDPEQPFYVFAESGTFSMDMEESEMHLQLSNGDVHFESPDVGLERHRRIAFEQLDYAFDISELVESWTQTRRPREMSLGELRAVVASTKTGDPLPDLYDKEPLDYAVQLQRRLALPVAPLVFALVAVPLALRRSRGARAWGALLGALLVFGYYALLSFGENLARSGTLPVPVGLWLPNVVFAALGLALLQRARRRSG